MVRQLFFLHIPKCAGRNLISEIEYWGGFGNAYITENNHKAFDFFASPYTAHFAAGHVTYPMISELGRDVFRFTFLRDPVERTLSAFNYILRTSHHELHTLMQSRGVTSVEKFCKDPIFKFHASNMQTRFLGIAYNFQTIVDEYKNGYLSYNDAVSTIRSMERSELTLENLKHAKRTISSLDFIGIQNYFEQSTAGLRKCLGVYSGELINRRLNSSGVASWRCQYSAKTIATIQKANALDIDLYRHAESLLRDRLSI